MTLELMTAAAHPGRPAAVGVPSTHPTTSRLRKSLALALVALALFSAVRLALYLIYPADFAELDAMAVLLAFARGLRFDLSVVALFFALPLAMINLPVPFAARRGWSNAWGWVAFALLVPCMLVMVGDLVYYDFVHRHAGNELLLMTGDLDYLGDAAFREYVGLFTATLASLAATALAWKRVLASSGPTRGRASARREWGAFALILVALFLGIRGSFSRKPLALVDAFRDQEFAAGNLSLNGMFTLLRSSVRGSAPEPDMTMEEARVVLELPDGDYPLERSHVGAQPTGRNLVVLLLESWDVRYVDSYLDEPRGLTPNFDRIAKDGLLFENIYAASQRSIGAKQALLVGVPSVPGNPELGFGLELSNVTRIGSIATGHDYEALYIQSAKRRSYYMDAVAPALGFGHYYGLEDIPQRTQGEGFPPKFGWDDDMFQFALDRLDEFAKPFLAVFVSGTMHSPYADPGERFRVVPHTSQGENGFVNTLHYSDYALGRFFERARESSWFDNTIFLVAADHAWRGSAGPNLRGEFRIPFFLLGPGIEPGRETRVRSQLDCLPWILEVLGFPDPYSALGHGLLSDEPRNAFVNKGSIAVGILSEQGALQHSLEQRIDAYSFAGEIEPSHFDALERELLATCRITRELVSTNRWAPPR